MQNKIALTLILAFITISYIGCNSCDGGGEKVQLIISSPLNGDTLDPNDDTDPNINGLNYNVTVVALNLEPGSIIELSSSSGNRSQQEFTGSNPIVFRNFTIATSSGTYTLIARVQNTEIESEPVTVTVNLEVECPTIEFLEPQNNDTISCNEDSSRSTPGFQYNIRVATNAQSGLELRLYIDSVLTAVTTVTSSVVEFNNVTLPADSLSHLYTVGFTQLPLCTASISFIVDCDLPQCSIVDPSNNVLNQNEDDYPDLEGLQVDVTVESRNIGGSGTAELTVDGSLVGSSSFLGTEATFSRVHLNEGERRLQAYCRDSAGNVGVSPVRIYYVDTTTPPLSIKAIRTALGERTLPLTNSTFNQDDDLDQVRDFIQLGLIVESNEEANGMEIVGMEDGNPMVDADGTITYNHSAENIVIVTCHDGRRTLGVRLEDEHENITEVTLQVYCHSGRPIVSIVDPTSNDVITIEDDFNGDPTDGLHYNIVACTDTNSTGELYINGGRVSSVRPVALQCNIEGGITLPYTLTFENVRIAGWREELRPQLQVKVTNDAGATGASPIVTPLVDTSPPIINFINPGCNSSINPSLSPDPDPSTPDRYEYPNFRINVSDVSGNLTLEIKDAAGNVGYNKTITPTSPYLRFDDAWLYYGENHLCVRVQDQNGNIEDSCAPPPPSDCRVDVLILPLLEFITPQNGSIFGKSDDPDPTTPTIFELEVRIWTDQPIGTLVTLNDGNTTLQTQTVQTSDPRGGSEAVFNLSLQEGNYTLTATIGGVSITSNITIDLTPPQAPTNLQTTILDRREVAVSLTWLAPSDPPFNTVTSYEIKISTTPITNETEFNSAQTIPWTGNIANPGTQQSIQIRYLSVEKPYYFAIRAVDRANQKSDFVATGSPLISHLRYLTLQGTQGEYLGDNVATGDINGDGISDLAIGAPGTSGSQGGSKVYIYFGVNNPTGFVDLTTPNVTITGPLGDQLGKRIIIIDWDGDGIKDLILTAPYGLGEGGSGVQGNGYGLIFFGRNSWNQSLSLNDANVIIRYNNPASTVRLGYSLSTIVDFNQDGIEDFIISAPRTSPGQAYIILGRNRSHSSISDGRLTVPDEADMIIQGRTSGLNFATDVTTPGDINNDNYSDIILCDYNDNNTMGICFIIYGQQLAIGSNQTLPLSSLPQTQLIYPPFSSQGQTIPSFGMVAKGLGDINGDGFEDVVITAPNYDRNNGGNSGIGYIFFGNINGLDTSNPATIDLGSNWLSLNIANDRLGESACFSLGVMGNPDKSFNVEQGTNLPDLIIISNEYDQPPGHLFVIYGKRSLTPGITIPIEQEADINLEINVGISLPGLNRVFLLEDLNNDGYREIALSSLSFNSSSGVLIIYY